MVFMVHKKLSGDDDRWLYLPALDLVKRIAASDKRTSFVGSDYFYEDVSGRSIDADTHQLLKTTDNYYVVRNTPKDAGSVEFAHYDMYIHKQTFLPVQIEFFDGAGQKYRIARAL
jgi:outer membrane lipoprotein-sorting protein